MGTSQQEEEILRSYLDHMVDFIVNQNLASNPVNSPVTIAANALTFSTLRRLGTNLQGILIEFLARNGLIQTPSPVINLDRANLAEVELTGSILVDIYLINVNLSKAHLQDAILQFVELTGTNLSGADLSSANLGGADLSNVNLSNATLYRADLANANLGGADLSNADLTRSFLKGATVTQTQLDQAASLLGATMPDGSIHP